MDCCIDSSELVREFLLRYSGNSVVTMTYALTQVSYGTGFGDNIFKTDWEGVFNTDFMDVLRMWALKGASQGSVCLYLSAAREFSRFCFERKLISASALVDLQKIKVMKEFPSRESVRLRKVVAADQRDLLLKACLDDLSINGVRDAAIVSVLFGSGMHLDQLIRIRLDGVEIEGNAINSTNSRNVSEKYTIADWAVSPVAAWLGTRLSSGIATDSPLFCRISKSSRMINRPLTGAGVRFILKERSMLSGLSGIARPSDARLTMGAQVLEDHGILVGRKTLHLGGLMRTVLYDLRSDDAVHSMIRKLR